eukprot:scaffold43066_cov67-Phaeocystis_antarctica.AAC.13
MGRRGRGRVRPASDGVLVMPNCSPHRVCHSSFALRVATGGRLAAAGCAVCVGDGLAGWRGGVAREGAAPVLAAELVAPDRVGLRGGDVLGRR